MYTALSVDTIYVYQLNVIGLSYRNEVMGTLSSRGQINVQLHGVCMDLRMKNHHLFQMIHLKQAKIMTDYIITILMAHRACRCFKYMYIMVFA